MENGKATIDRLELHNRKALIQIAQDKLRNGKPLTKREMEAVESATREAEPHEEVVGENTERFGVAYRCLKELSAPEESDLQVMLGNTTVRSLPQVAQAFGMSPNTVTQSWRQAGMPGSPGRYELTKILAWRLSHEYALAQKQRSSPSESKEEIEKKILAKKLDKMIEDEKVRAGQLVDRGMVVAEACAHVAMCREGLLGIPRQLEVTYGPDAAEECERLIRHQLTAFSEKQPTEFSVKGIGSDM